MSPAPLRASAPRGHRSPRPRSERRTAPALVAALALAAVAVLHARNAHADAYDEALRQGASARDAARQSRQAGDWERALEQFERAVAARDTTAARFELGQAAAELGRVDVAFESYELALERGLAGRAAAVAQAYVKARRGEVARVEIVAPAGSSLYVNGRERARAPLARPLLVPAGNVRVGVIAAGHEPWQASVQLEAQSTRRLAPTLTPLVELTARVEPWPEASPALALRAPGAAPEPEPESRPSWVGQHPGAVVLLSAAGASLLVGGWFTFSYTDTRERAGDARSQIVRAHELYVSTGMLAPDSVPCGQAGVATGMVPFNSNVASGDQSRVVGEFANACRVLSNRNAAALRARNAAFVGFGVSAAALGAVLTWYIADGAATPEADHGKPAPRVLPLIGAGTGGVLLNLEF